MIRRHAAFTAALLAVVAITAAPLALAGEGSTATAGKVDVNTAGVEELQSLPGIGPSLARKIVEHRREHGPFRRVEDLLEIRGIGEKSLRRFRDLVVVSKRAEP